MQHASLKPLDWGVDCGAMRVGMHARSIGGTRHAECVGAGMYCAALCKGPHKSCICLLSSEASLSDLDKFMDVLRKQVRRGCAAVHAHCCMRPPPPPPACRTVLDWSVHMGAASALPNWQC